MYTYNLNYNLQNCHKQTIIKLLLLKQFHISTWHDNDFIRAASLKPHIDGTEGQTKTKLAKNTNLQNRCSLSIYQKLP